MLHVKIMFSSARFLRVGYIMLAQVRNKIAGMVVGISIKNIRS